MSDSEYDNEKTDKKDSVKSLLKDFGENTTAHGFGSVLRAAGIFARLAWCVIILAAFGVLIYQMIGIFTKYFSFPKLTQVELKTKLQYFPSITICNVNPFRLSEIEDLDEKLALRKFYDKHLAEKVDKVNPTEPTKSRMRDVGTDDQPADYPDQNEDYYDYNYDDEYGSYDDDQDYEDERKKDPDEDFRLRRRFTKLASLLDEGTRKRIGHQKQALIVKCTFMGANCSDADFQHIFSRTYGNCFIFNSAALRNRSLIARRIGNTQGLQLILNLEMDEYMPFHTTGYGARVVMHEFGTLPFAGKYGQSVPAGFSTSVGLRLTEIKRLGYPYGNCVSKYQVSSTGEDYIDRKYIYSQNGCVALCRYIKFVEICNCRDESYDFLYSDYMKSFRKCVPQNESLEIDQLEHDEKCVKNVENQVKKGTKGYDCSCPESCSEKAWLKTSSINQWPSKGYQPFLIDKVCQDMNSHGHGSCDVLKALDESEIRKNFAQFNVFFQDLNFQLIEEFPAYEVPNFLSDIGGTLGLWCGFSVLTGAEVLILFFSLFKLLVLKISGENRKKRSEQSIPMTDVKT